MTNWNPAANQALEKAAEVRRAARIDGVAPLCVYDLIESQFGNEIDLRFQPLKSLEGMYSRQRDGTGVIIVSTERPAGRRRFTCAHELGHHLFQHECSLDELIEEQRGGGQNDREKLVDLFAGYLLMPKLAIMQAARDRQIDIKRPAAEDIYRLANYFGVGFNTLVTHACHSIHLLNAVTADRLGRVSLKKVKENIAGSAISGDLIAIDTSWKPFRPIDAIAGDYILLPHKVCVEGDVINRIRDTSNGALYQAVKPGMGRVDLAGVWSAYVRIERARYRGLGQFRNLEDPSDDET